MSRVKKRLFFGGVFFCLGALCPAEASQTDFQFSAPGWQEIQQDAGVEKMAEARSGHVGYVAIDPRDSGATKVTAIIGSGRLEVTQDFVKDRLSELNAYAPDIRELSRRTGGGEISLPTVRALDSQIIKINNVPVLRIVSEVVSGNDKQMSVHYYMPGRSAFAVMTFLTRADLFEKRQSEFDLIARQTIGIASPDSDSPFWNSIFGRIVIGCIVGALYGAYEYFRRKLQGPAKA